jgi:hypothetical protein
MVDEKKLLDSVILSLADQFEAGNRKWVTIEPASAEEYEPLRQCMAKLVAEGSASTPVGITGAYQLTKEGYSQYEARITALRSF